MRAGRSWDLAAAAGAVSCAIPCAHILRCGAGLPSQFPRAYPLLTESKAGSKFLFYRASYRKTASHFSGRTLGPASPNPGPNLTGMLLAADCPVLARVCLDRQAGDGAIRQGCARRTCLLPPHGAHKAARRIMVLTMNGWMDPTGSMYARPSQLCTFTTVEMT
jgi:hypothetical protein